MLQKRRSQCKSRQCLKKRCAARQRKALRLRCIVTYVRIRIALSKMKSPTESSTEYTRPLCCIVHLAETALHEYQTNEKPWLVSCSGADPYVVKRPPLKRLIISDFVVGSLGNVLCAPVPQIDLVYLTGEFLEMNPQCSDLGTGYAHGSREVRDVHDSDAIEYIDGENRPRFALLSLLYGWMDPKDYQYLYGNDPPHLVWSHDHGWFLPGGNDWNSRTLADASPARVDYTVVNQVELSQKEINIARECLDAVTTEQVQDIINSIPKEWGILDFERDTLFGFITKRRIELLESSKNVR